MLTTLDAEELEELIYNDRNMHVKVEAKRRRVWLTNSLPREAFETTCLEGKLAKYDVFFLVLLPSAFGPLKNRSHLYNPNRQKKNRERLNF